MMVIDFMNMKTGEYHEKQLIELGYNLKTSLAEIKQIYPNDPNPDLSDPKYKDIVKDLPFAPLIAGGLAEAFGIEKEFLTLELWRDISNGYVPAKSLPKDSPFHAKAIETPRGLLVPLNKNPTPIDEAGTYRPELAGKAKRTGTEFVFGFGENLSNVITAKAIADPEVEKVFADKMNDIFKNIIIPEMERDAYVRMGTDGKDIDYAANLLVVAFQHIENRSTEPYRHFHFDVINTAQGLDDQLYSVMNDLIVLNKDKYTALLQIHSKTWMEKEWGLSFKPVYLDEDKNNEYLKDHERNIASYDVEDKFVPQSLRDHLGARTKEMDALMKKEGKSGFLAEEIARKESRKEKTELSPSELKAQWADLYAKHGFTTEHIAHHENFSQVHDPEAQLPAPELLIGNFLRKHKDVAFTETQFSSHVVKQLLNTCSADTALRYAEAIFNKECVQMLDKEKVPYYQTFLDDQIADPMEYQQKQIRYGRDVRFTAKTVLEQDQYVVTSYKARQAERGFMLDKGSVVSAILDFEKSQSKPGKPFQFAMGQKNAIVQAMTEPGALFQIAGRAGSGKSTLLKVVVEEYEKAGFNVWGTSTSSTATKGLAESTAMRSGQFLNTAELFIRIQSGKVKLDHKTVILMDEAGMASTEEMFKLTKAVNEAGAKIILTGEKEQLQSVGFGGLFKTLNERFLTAPVTDINRQKEDWARTMVEDFASGRAAKSIRTLYDNGMVVIKKTDKGRLAQLVHDYTTDKNDAKEKLIIAATNQDVERINLAIRAELQKTGALPTEECTLKGKDGIDRQFAVGDRLIITKNQKTDDAHQVKLANSETGKVIAIGRLSSNGKPNSLKVEMDNGKVHFININKEHNIKHGYCSTVHRSQGQTKNNAYYWVSPTLNNLHQAYVACSRHRFNVKMYLSESMVETLADRMKGKEPTASMKKVAVSVAKQKKLDLPPSTLSSYTETKEFLDKHVPPKEGKKARHVLDDYISIAESMSQTMFKRTTYDYELADGKHQNAYIEYKKVREQPQALKEQRNQALKNQPTLVNALVRPPQEAPKENMNQIGNMDSINTLSFKEKVIAKLQTVKKAVREKTQSRGR